MATVNVLMQDQESILIELVKGLTLLHESETGVSSHVPLQDIADKSKAHQTYGFIHQMSLTTLSNVDVLNNITYMQACTELDIASVGYYKTSRKNGVIAELSATAHAGILHYPLLI